MHLGRLHSFRIDSDLNFDTNPAGRPKHVGSTVVAQITSTTIHPLSSTHI